MLITISIWLEILIGCLKYTGKIIGYQHPLKIWQSVQLQSGAYEPLCSTKMAYKLIAVYTYVAMRTFYHILHVNYHVDMVIQFTSRSWGRQAMSWPVNGHYIQVCNSIIYVHTYASTVL